MVAIVGATGAVGVELLRCLEARRFPLSALRLLASSRSAGRTLRFHDEEVAVEVLTEASFLGVDIALFSAGATISRQYAPLAVQAGALVVDNSSAFRMDPAVPLVVPEVNASAMARHSGIVANPNCVAAIATMALAPLHRRTNRPAPWSSAEARASGFGRRWQGVYRECRRGCGAPRSASITSGWQRPPTTRCASSHSIIRSRPNPTAPLIELSEMLTARAPLEDARVIFSNSGSEANDTAIKMAWYYNNSTRPPGEEEDHRPAQGLSWHYPGRRLSHRAACQPPLVRLAATGLPAHDDAALLPRGPGRRERRGLRQPVRRGIGKR